MMMQEFILKNLGPASRRDQNLLLNWAQINLSFKKSLEQKQPVLQSSTSEKRASVHDSSICDRRSNQSVDSSENESPLKLGRGRTSISSCSNHREKYEYKLIPSMYSNR